MPSIIVNINDSALESGGKVPGRVVEAIVACECDMNIRNVYVLWGCYGGSDGWANRRVACWVRSASRRFLPA